ncbi:MAG: hypothetical protein AMS18_02100 [Gemmatimonas sp. SG8_17]|nr:MAG: hypothetical protein AMS18_02100 [Gemmatimonas sp. SG8_17]
MLLKTSSALLVCWGLVNAVGGTIGARMHPAPWIGALFFAVGVIVAVGGVGLWRGRSWGFAMSLGGLVAMSLVAFLSAILLRGVGGIRLSHHVTRLLISGCLLMTAWLGMRRLGASRVDAPSAQ